MVFIYPQYVSDSEDYAEISSIEENENNSSYLVPEGDLKTHKIRIIPGDKVGSQWMVVDDIYVYHKNDTSGDQVYWECSKRKQER